MAKIKAVVFDMYETLVSNPIEGWMQVFEGVCRSQNLPIDPQTLYDEWKALEVQFRKDRLNLEEPEKSPPFKSYEEAWRDCFAGVFAHRGLDGDAGVAAKSPSAPWAAGTPTRRWPKPSPPSSVAGPRRCFPTPTTIISCPNSSGWASASPWSSHRRWSAHTSPSRCPSAACWRNWPGTPRGGVRGRQPLRRRLGGQRRGHERRMDQPKREDP